MLNLSQPDLSQLFYFLFESMNHFVRFERSSFFALGNALAKNSGSGRRKSCPNNIISKPQTAANDGPDVWTSYCSIR